MLVETGGFEAMFVIVFVLILGVFIVTFVKGISQWGKNNKSPRLTVNATVVTKRTSVSGGNNTSSHTSYYVTFQVDSGNRMELQVYGVDYAMLVENDYGNLTFQGTRFIGFERKI